MYVKHVRAILGPTIGVLLLALVSACGAPQQGISVRNVSDATAGAPRTEAPTTGAVATAVATKAAPTSDMSHEATSVPITKAAGTAAPTQAAAAGAATGDFVVGWLLYGTPTPTQNAPGAGTAAATQQAAATRVATKAPTQAAASGAATNDFVVGWLLYGTPTPAVNRPAGTTSAAMTNTPIQTTPAPAATTAPNQGATKAATTAATQASVQQTTATRVPPTAVPSTPAASTATKPAGTTTSSGGASAAAGNPSRGQQIFNGIGTCSSCHDVANNVTIVGPSQKGIASKAGTRKPGMSAHDYLYESIVKPNVFVVPGFQAGLMPQNFGQSLSAQQIEDVIAYLMTLK